MSEVKRYVSTRVLHDAGMWSSSATPHTYVRASDYDTLAQRCRGLEIEASRLSGWLGDCDRERLAAQQERDQLRAEVEALRGLARECAEYLNTDKETTIGNGSILHHKMIEASK